MASQSSSQYDELIVAWWNSKFDKKAEAPMDEVNEQLAKRFQDCAAEIPFITALIIDTESKCKIKLDDLDSFVKRHGEFTTAFQNCAKSFFVNHELNGWWFGKIVRDDAHQLVAHQPNGSYILRVSSNKESYAMSYSKQGAKGLAEVKSVVIECNRGKFNVQKDQHIYDTIPELLAHHEHAKHPLKYKQDMADRIELIKKNYNPDTIAKITPIVYSENKNYSVPSSGDGQKTGTGYGAVGKNDPNQPSGYGAATSESNAQSSGHGNYGAAVVDQNAQSSGHGNYGAAVVDQNAQPSGHAYGAAIDPNAQSSGHAYGAVDPKKKP